MLSLELQIPLQQNTLSLWSRGMLHEYLQQDTLTVTDAHAVWGYLLGSLRTPDLSEKETTSTCNCLRIFLGSISTAKNHDVRGLPLVRDEWMSCYHAVCSTWSRAKTKPLVQVLEVLLQVAKDGMPRDELRYIWEKISLELSGIILSGQPTRDLKRALGLSSIFLEKELPYEIYQESARQNIRQSQRYHQEQDMNHSDTFRCLVNAIFLVFEHHDARSSAEKCFKTLLKHSVPRTIDTQSLWALVKSFVADHVDSLDMITTSIFPVLLKMQPYHPLELIQSIPVTGDVESLLFLLALLQSLREQEMVSQTDLIVLLRESLAGRASDSPDAIRLLLSHADDDIRIRAVRLLATSKMTNDPVSMPVLQHLQQSIPLWFRPGGSHQRGELLSTIRRLLVRIRGGSSTLEKAEKSSTAEQGLLEAHKNFMKTLIATTADEIRPNVSYQRRVMGLSILKYILDSGIDLCDRALAWEPVSHSSILSSPVQKSLTAGRNTNNPNWPFSMCLRTTSIAQDLLNLVSDAYEDVRALSTSILRHLLVAESQSAYSKTYIGQLEGAISLLTPRFEAQAAQTNRSDHADGLGRLYALSGLTEPANCTEESVYLHLIVRLEQVMEHKSTFSSTASEPLHGLLLGVMYCIMDANAVHHGNRVISICRQLWMAVRDRLCIDTPEMTDDEADESEEVAVGPKDMLSYSWRALRDSSLLLRALLKTTRSLEDGQLLQELHGIGHLCMEQLTSLRHRGAFSTVAQTFTACCQRAVDVQGQELCGLRYQWYQEAEAQIEQQAHRLTRRSAGLPALIAAIMLPDDEISFRSFINSFIARSHMAEANIGEKTTISLPQVHAMNALREVMINSRFCKAVLPHLQELLTLAMKNLGSKSWAVQNCGLMLYRACLLRLPGDDASQLLGWEAVISESSSAPLKLALDLLRNGSSPGTTEPDDAPIVVEQKFAALDMIAHLLPTTKLKHDIRAQLVGLLESPVWPVRERAAEVLAFLTPIEELQRQLGESCDALKSDRSQNFLHGTLIYSRQLVKKWISKPGRFEGRSIIGQAVQQLLIVTTESGNRCLAPPAWAAVFEIANDVTEHLLRVGVTNTIPPLSYENLSSNIDITGHYLPEKALFYNIALSLIMSDGVRFREEKVFSALLDGMREDPNIARYVLERLLANTLVFQPKELLRLFQALVLPTHTPYIQLVADMVLISIGRSCSRWKVMDAQQFLHLLDHASRTCEISALNLVARARLLSLLIHQQGEHPDLAAPLYRQRKRFEQDVWYAAQEGIDTHVRTQAVEALSAHQPLISCTEPDSFALLFTLRNLLNDDDDNVRSVAASITSAFFNRKNGAKRAGTSAPEICAPAIAIQLEGYLCKLGCEHIPGPAFPLSRLLNQRPNTCLTSFLRCFPVDGQLKSIQNEARVLFAIERQNLYIDEVHEIHFWFSMCMACADGNTQLGENVTTVLASWIINGLSTILTLLGSVRDASMLPNATHDLETLLLCLRVVSVAISYISWSRNMSSRSTVADHDLEGTCQTIEQQLEALREVIRRGHFNPELSRSFDSWMEAVVR